MANTALPARPVTAAAVPAFGTAPAAGAGGVRWRWRAGVLTAALEPVRIHAALVIRLPGGRTRGPGHQVPPRRQDAKAGKP